MNHKSIKKRILEIIEELELNVKNIESVGLLTGVAGVTLFFLHSYRAKIIQKEKVDYMLTTLLEKVEEKEIPYSLSHGLIGVGFVIQEFIQEDFLSSDYNDFLSQVDGFIKPITISLFKNNMFDYMHSGLGAIDYLLTRKNKNNSSTIKNSLDLLLKNGIEDDFGISWFSKIDRRSGTNEIHRPLGAAHGQVSILHMLTKLYENNYLKDNTIIHSSIMWILSQQNFDFTRNSIFPARLIDDKFTTLPSRLGWCTGDLGILYPLYLSSKKLGFNEINKRIVDMLIYTCQKKDLKKNIIIDNGFCHGVAGIVHIYHKLYLETDLEIFKSTFSYWLKILLQKQKTLEDNLPDRYDINTGISGIGLVLLSVLGFDSDWDRFFVLS